MFRDCQIHALGVLSWVVYPADQNIQGTSHYLFSVNGYLYLDSIIFDATCARKVFPSRWQKMAEFIQFWIIVRSTRLRFPKILCSKICLMRNWICSNYLWLSVTHKIAVLLLKSLKKGKDPKMICWLGQQSPMLLKLKQAGVLSWSLRRLMNRGKGQLR